MEYIKNSVDYIYLDIQFLWIVKILADIFVPTNVSVCVYNVHDAIKRK